MTVPSQPSSGQSLGTENAALRARLVEAEAMLQAIRSREMAVSVAERNAKPKVALGGLNAEPHRLRDEMLARTSEAMIAVDTAGRITFFNAAAERQYGVHADDVRGRDLAAVFTRHWPSPEEEAAAWTALRGHGEWHGEYLERTPQGRELHVESSMSVLRDSHGDMIGHLSVVRDITERHQAEVALRRNEALFSTIIEQAPGGVYVVDAQFRVSAMNAETRPYFAAVQPLIGHDFDEALEIVWGPEIGPQIATRFRHTLATGERYVSPRFSEQRHDIGVQQAFQWETQRITLSDGQPGVVCYFQEITARERAEAALRESEARLSGILRHSPAGIVETDAHGAMTLVNPCWCEMLGHAEAELLGRALLDFTHPACVDATATAFRRLASGGPDIVIELDYCRKDGSVLHAQSHVTAVRSLAGEFLGMIAVVLDVSERLRAETELRRLADNLSEVDRRKDVFLATLAHELRNPLAPIRNGLQIMKLAQADAGIAERARAMMERQVEQMTRLIDDLMDVSRINQGKIQLRKTRMPLTDAVRSAVESSRALIDSQGHELVVDVPPEPIYVDGDVVRLSQVVANLLNNAAKYTDRGGCIRLAVEQHGSDAVVSVADSGEGIAADMLDRVFDMFAQIDGSLEKSHGGLGLGPHIVKRLVELHDGSISAESGGRGSGSRFTMRLPARLARGANGSADRERDHDRGLTAAPVRRRILVVDDNHDVAISLAEMLHIMGNDTQTAFDGEQAFVMAEAFRPDVVVMDIGMPKMNGYDTCRRIRGQPWGHNIVIIAQSGWGQDDQLRMSQDAGFTSHLVKPVDPAALETLLAGLPSTTV